MSEKGMGWRVLIVVLSLQWRTQKKKVLNWKQFGEQIVFAGRHINQRCFGYICIIFISFFFVRRFDLSHCHVIHVMGNERNSNKFAVKQNDICEL